MTISRAFPETCNGTPIPLWRTIPAATLSRILLFLSIAAAAHALADPPPAPPPLDTVRAALQQAAQYRLGDSRAFFNPVLEAARAASGDDDAYRAELATLLAAFLDSNATADAKDMVCRVLAPIASQAQSPALLRLLDDPALFANVLLALRMIPGESVDTALMTHLKAESDPARKHALINALGERRCTAALPALTELARNDNHILADAALRALIHLATDEAFAAIESLRQQYRPGNRLLFDDARLKQAEWLLDRDDAPAALALCDALLNDAAPHQRIAAARLRLCALGERAAEAIGEALDGNDPQRRLAALSFIGACDQQTAMRLLDTAAQWPENAQLALVLALERNFPRMVLDRAIALTHAPDPALAETAQALVTRLDPYEMIKVLAAEAAASEGAPARQKLDTLTAEDLPGNNRDRKIESIYFDLAPQLPPPHGAELLASVARRAARTEHDQTLAEFIQRAGNENLPGPLRAAAFQAIALLGSGKELAVAMPWLLSPGARDAREALEQAIVALALRAAPQELHDAIARIPVDALPDEVLASVLRILGQFNTPAARARMMDFCLRASGETAMTAARALAQTPHDDALDDLLRLAREGQSIPQRVVAFRGAMRLMARRNAAPQDTAALLAQALDAAPRAEEKQLVLAQLIAMNDLAAMPALLRCVEDRALAADAQRALTALVLAHATPAASAQPDDAPKAIDTDPDSAWRAEGATPPAWFSVHFPADLTLRHILFHGNLPGTEKSWTIQTSAAGKPWEPQPARIQHIENGMLVTLHPPVPCRGILLQGNGPDLADWSLREIAFAHPSLQEFGLAPAAE